MPEQTAPLAPNHNPSTIEDSGWYVFDRMSFGEKWQIMLGARGSRYANETTSTRYQADDVNPSVAVMYKPVAGLSVYDSYLEGLEESGQAPANRANAGELLPPALSKQKEIGVKAGVARGVLLQAAYFDIERPSTTVDASNRFVLNGLAQYRGVELAASGEVTRNLALVASAAHAEIDGEGRLLSATTSRARVEPASTAESPTSPPSTRVFGRCLQ